MASTVLSRTQTTGSYRKFTLSAWNKRSGLSSYQGILNAYSSDSDRNAVFWQTTDELVVYFKTGNSSQIFLQTNAKFRDTNGWYHVVVAVDTEQATASDRVKVYVNGEQQTSFSTETYPSQNSDFSCINRNGQAVELGVLKYGAGPSTGYFDGLMSHYHFIDGTQYDASTFGSTDSTTGEWKIKTSPSVTYGTNGFFILKDGNSVTDQSGNGNNFTVGGGTLTNTEDCPSNVFATFNPLGALSTPPTFSNGNTTASVPNSGGVFRSTLAVSSGKYYCEVKLNSMNSLAVGVQPIDEAYNQGVFSNTSAVVLYGTNGTIYKNGSIIGSIASVSDNDIIGIALDLDNNNVYFSKNGQYASGLSGAWNQTFSNAYAIALNSGNFYTIVGQNGSSGSSSNISINFGNGYFGTTAVASAGTNASGIGIFEYDVPTGYTALSTKGLNE